MKYLLMAIIFMTVTLNIARSDCLNNDQYNDVAKEYFYIETATYKNIPEVIGRVLYYSKFNEQQPAIVLIITNKDQLSYIKIVKDLIKYHKLNLILFVEEQYE